MQPITLLQCVLVTVARCYQATWITRDRLSPVSLGRSEKDSFKKEMGFSNLTEVSYWAISHL